MTTTSTSTPAVAGAWLSRRHHLIGGQWVEPGSNELIEVVDSATEEVLGSVPAGTAADVDAAVVAARAAFEPWAATSREERVALCVAVAAGLKARSDELAALVSHELGSPLAISSRVHVAMARSDFASMAAAAEAVEWEREVGSSLVVREPVGVVGAITPWNYPLHQIAAKVAPALVAGCTVVLKPSEVTPLSAYALMEVLLEAGLPPGVVNLVCGDGPVVGEAIAAHEGVDMVSFTGSVRAGARVGELAAATIKRVALELGGKSPYVILDDVDDDELVRAVRNGVQKCYLNSGQTCSALTRMLVPRSRLAAAERAAAATAEAMTVGDPFDETTRLGPLVSARQRDRVLAHIEGGLDQGARVVTGGGEAPDGLTRGYYVRPTVLSDVTPEMTVAREEIFGPVLVILAYDDEDDAVRIANGTEYGLAAGVWSASAERATALARRLRAGQVEVNGGAFNPVAPFGGYRRSGNGRELGSYGIEEMLEVKSIQR